MFRHAHCPSFGGLPPHRFCRATWLGACPVAAALSRWASTATQNERKPVTERAQELAALLTDFPAGLAEAVSRLVAAAQSLPLPRDAEQALTWVCVLDCAAAACPWVEAVTGDPTAAQILTRTIGRWMAVDGVGGRFQRAFWRLVDRERWAPLLPYIIAYGPPPPEEAVRALAEPPTTRSFLSALTWTTKDGDGKDVFHPPVTEDIFRGFALHCRRLAATLWAAPTAYAAHIPLRPALVDFGDETYAEAPRCAAGGCQLSVVEDKDALPVAVSHARRDEAGELVCEDCALWAPIIAETARLATLYELRRRAVLGAADAAATASAK